MGAMLSLLLFVGSYSVISSASSMTEYMISPDMECMLKIRVLDCPSGGSDVLVAVWNEESKWLDENHVYYYTRLKMQGGKVEGHIALPYGEYAISIFYDKNANDKLDKGLLGIPKEPFAFSNDAKCRFGPPRWSEASVVLDREEMEVAIRF